MSIDLDAIQARADAATPGPWTIVDSDQCVWAVSDYRIVVDKSVWDPEEWQQRGKTDADFIAHAREDVPALVAEVRTLAADLLTAESQSFHRVLDGDPADVAAALDALPDRAVVTSEKLISFDMFLKQPQVTTQGSAWYQAGLAAPIDSGFLARNYSPLVVIR